MISKSTSVFVTKNKYTCQQDHKFICIISDMETYSERLTWAINNAGMTQSQLAKLAGIKPQTIQYLCSSRNNAQGSIHNASFAEILNVSALWLETGKGNRDPQQNKALEFLKMLEIDPESIEMDQVESIKAIMKMPEENREKAKKIISVFSEPDDKPDGKKEEKK